MKAKFITFVRGLKNGTPPRFQSYLKSLTILLGLMLSVNVWGAELTYTHAMTAKPNAGDNTLSGVTWTVDLTSNVGSMNTGNYAGVQIGTSSNTGSIKFTTKQAWGAQEGTYKGYTKVKYVYVWLNNGSGTIDATVKIGGVSASKSGTVSKNTSAGNDYKKASKLTFTPGTSGDNGAIEIVASTSSKAGYFCAIEVVCEKPAAPAEPFSVTLKRYGQADDVISNLTSAYTLPAAADEDPACEGWEFKGWSTSSVTSTTTTPTFVTQATATGTYYAVYGKTEGGGTVFSKYEQVSLGGTIADGQYLISTGSYTMAGSGNTGASFSPGTTEATAKEYTITTLGSGVFTIKGPDNNYIGGANGTGLTFSTTTPSENAYKWKYTSNGIQNQAYTTRYIKAYNTTDFRHYATSNGTTTYLYKRVETSGSTTTYTSSPECAEAGKTLISYDKNTEDEATGDIPASVEQDNGVAYTVSSATLTRSGYNFVGWNTDKDATEGISTIPAASITGSPITLYAIWQAKTVQSVVVSGNPTKKNYEAGETFDPAGLTVTVNYGDESVVVTEGIVWAITPDNGVLTKGQTSVNVTATALGKTSAPYEVTGLNVTAAPSSVTWDLTKDETATATEDEISWTSDFATMIDEKAESTTAANNYYPGDKDSHTSTRFYKNSVLTVAPVDNNVIVKVEFTATSEGYASALQGSTWTNASASVSNTTLVTVTPTDGTQAFSATIGGTCGFTAVKVYYQPGAELASIAVKTAPKTTYNAGESFDPTGLIITATYSDASTKDITYDANDTKWEFLPDLTDKLDATDNEVIISYNNVSCDDALEITVNRIASSLAAVSATKILVVDDAPSLADWYTIDANYDGTVTFQSDNEEVFYAEDGEGLALEAGSATLTINAPQTDIYAQASVTVAVTVNAAAVPCSVKWMNNGEEYTIGDPSTSVNAGQKVTKLPTAPDPCDAQHKFMGWTNNPIATPQADAPSVLFTDAASAPTVDADGTIYYAVYAVKSIDENIDSYDFTSFVSAQSVEFTTDGGNKITMAKGSGGSNPAWNAGESEARLYATGSMTISSSKTISKIVYTYSINANSKGVTPTIDDVSGKTNVGTWNAGTKTWTGSDTEVTFSTSGSAGNVGFTNVTIYGEPIITYSDYSTSCSAVELDKIELSGEYPTTFLMGDEFSHEGMTITASYTNSTTTKNVTNLATFSGYDANTLGEQTITVSYTEGEGVDAITKTATYKVTVSDWPNKTIAEFIAAEGTKCYLTAFVSNINGSQYDLTDNSGTIHGYKYTLAEGVSALANGDRIRVKAEEYELFQSTTHEVKNIVVVEKLAYSAIAVSGTMNVTEYTAGNVLSSEGLVVKGKYADEAEATHEITGGITWNMPTAVLGTSEYDVKATVGGLSDTYHVTGITVNAPKVLESLSVVGTPKTTYWVGDQFGYAGLVFKAKYENDDNLVDVTEFCTFSRAAGQITDAIVDETITVSYTEGSITKEVEFVINANWMTLADLVEKITPTETAVKVWVKVTDAEIKAKSYSYITTDVIYGDNQTQEVKIYQNGVSNDWEVKGKISGELKDVDWKHYTGGGNDDWELCPTNWDWVTNYVAPEHTPVTGVSLNTNALSITQGKKEQLTATVAPADAYDKTVEWSIINDNANGKITVSDAGLVSVAADATVGATATIQVTTTNGGFTATCTVTVEELPIWATTYTSNVTVGNDKVKLAEAYQPAGYPTDGYDAKKAGSSSSAGSTTITVPAGTYAIHFHAAGWNNEDVTLAVKKGETVLGSFDIPKDAGMSSNSPFTLANNPATEEYFMVALSDITEETTITFAATSGKRFAIYGVNALAPAAITIDPALKDFGEVKQGFDAEQVFTLTPNAFAIGTITAEIEGEGFSASAVADNKVTVTFAPTEITEYSATLVIKHDGEQMCTAALSGKGIAATTPEIVVSDDEIDFGTVKQDATITPQTVTVTLNYLDAATAAISGTDFSIDKTELVAGENTITISATAATSGTKNATITITGEGATTKTIAVKMDVTSKWAGEYTSNVEVGNDKVIIAKEEYEAIKAGSGSSAGSTTITVPAGTYAIHFHAAGWNSEDVTLAVKNGETVLGSFNLYKDAGVSGSGPSYTLQGENYDTDQYFYVEFDALEEETAFTFVATSGKRFVLYGVNQEGGLTKELSAIEVSGTPNKLQYTEGAEFDPTGLTVMGTFKFGEVTLPDKEDVTDQVTEWVVDPVTLASTTTSVSVVAKVGEIASEAYTVENVRVLPENTDIINASTGTATTSTYKEFTATGLTNTQYAGKTALNNGNLTLSNASSHPGIVSTFTIGYIKSVKVTIADGNTRNLDVYGSHRAYQSAEDLYSLKNAIRGTKIGTLTASGVLDLSEAETKYEFIGIRSEEGSIQVPEIQITWTPVEFLRISVAENIEGGTIDIDRTVATAEEAGNVQVTIEPTPNEGLQFDKLVIYNESDEDVTSSITIAESGLAFTMPDYNVKVGATFKSQPVTAISLDKSAITIDKNSTETLTASFLPNGAFTEVTWTSDNEAIATVENGVVTGKGQGTTTITASCNDGALTATCSVTVNAQPEYVLVTNASNLQDGDVIVLGSAANNAVNGGYNTGKYLDKVDATITEGVLTSNDLMEITLCKTDAGWNLVTEQGHLGAIATKNLLINKDYTDWTISISGNAATISAGDTPGRFLYNVQSSRFLNYTSSTSTTMLLPEIYRLSSDTKKVVKLMDKNNVYAIYRVQDGENVTLSVALPTGCTKGWTIDGKTYAKNATIENVTADMVLYAIQSQPEEIVGEDKEISPEDVNQGSTITIGDGNNETNVTISSDGGQEKAQAYQIVVKKNATVTISTPSDISNLEVEVGGKVTVETTKTLTVNNFVIKSTMAGGQSGQVIGVTTENFVVEGEAYYDVVMDKCAEGKTIADQWHAFAVPFNVDAINGVYDLDDNKLTNEVNYAIMDYHGDVRAKGQYGWKKFRGIMTPGVFYLMTVDGLRTTYRMKMNGEFHASNTTISVQQYAQSGAGTKFDAGWNGIANNQLNYSSIGVDVQVLNPTSYTFETMTASTYNFTVGTPFFYQADATGTIDLTAPNASENYAPRRVGAAEAKNIAVTLGNDNYTDRLYISATDEATNEYQIGRDLVKMTMTNTPAVPQIFAEAYGTKLCMVDAPMMYDEAVYALNLYAPANGEYTIGAAQVKGYEVFLTQYGSVIWNLSMSEATIELTKGNNTEYGLILKATSGHAPTDINTINGQESVQKFLYNSNIYLRHNNNTFNVQGQLVK